MQKKHIIIVLGVLVTFMVVLSASAWAAGTGKVNINKASVEELTTLKGIGPSYAQKIVDYRTQSGPFKKAEDITNVPGIGTKTWEANKDKITVK
jgi:competence protein ComEA